MTRKDSPTIPFNGKKRFIDRTDAGRHLADRLERYRGDPSVLVLGLTRGGVPVAFEVASRLGAQLDFMVVRKIGVPGHEELAMGAVASGGVRILNEDLIDSLRISDATIAAAAVREEVELRQREERFRGGTDPLPIEGRKVILIDDGLATGATMKAAVLAVRSKRPRCIVLAVPVSPAGAGEEFRDIVDELVIGLVREPFRSVGQWYDDFDQVEDGEVRSLIEANRHALSPTGSA